MEEGPSGCFSWVVKVEVYARPSSRDLSLGLDGFDFLGPICLFSLVLEVWSTDQLLRDAGSQAPSKTASPGPAL